MGSTMGNKIDYNGVRALRDQRHIPSKKTTQVTPPPPPGPKVQPLTLLYTIFDRKGTLLYTI